MPAAYALKPARVSTDECFEMSVPVLETPRLRLRPPHSGDTPWLEELLRDAEVRRHTLQPVRGWLRAWLEAPAQVFAPARWAIDDREAGPCGWISLGAMDEMEWLTVGFELRQRFWNRGIMTEALERIVDYHFEQTPGDPLGAIVFEPNYASRRVFEKAGFAETGLGDCQGHPSVFLELLPARYGMLRQATQRVRV
ncbi:MAG: GNAT family N-acetyltransferase [Bryobacteraceae bacterium]|nr:GNAT family N-acetyltransferase [Bryobacteraceae bacterium]